MERDCTLRIRPVAVAIAAALLLAQARAATVEAADPAKGQQTAGEICGACHSPDGNSTIVANPRLAGLSAEYIVKQLSDFAKPPGDKSGRDNPVMAGFAMTLTEGDRHNVAAWFSAQSPKPDAARDRQAAEAGQRIYRSGIPEKAVPACAGCHGPTGAGLPVLYPRIAGQHPEYLAAALRTFREGGRRNSLPMEQISFRLNDQEINAVANYAAGLRSN